MVNIKRSMVAYVGKAADREGEVYSMIASTGGVDREGDMILPAAFKKSLRPYLKKNPVILYQHQQWEPPVAKAVDARVLDSGLEIDFVWAETEAAKELRYLYDEGFMNAFSVGFLAHQVMVDSAEIERLAAKLGMEEGEARPRRVFTEAELLEVSAVTIPANADALLVRALRSRFGDKAVLLDGGAESATIEETTAETAGVRPAPAESQGPHGALLDEAARVRSFADVAVKKERQ